MATTNPSQSSAQDGKDAENLTELPLDVIYGLLSNERRRRTLHYLETVQETTLGELAEHLAAVENDKPVEAVSSEERKRLYICLYQCHLPKLDEADAVEFEEARKHLSAGPPAAYLRRFLPAPSADDADGGDAVTDVASTIARRFPLGR